MKDMNYFNKLLEIIKDTITKKINNLPNVQIGEYGYDIKGELKNLSQDLPICIVGLNGITTSKDSNSGQINCIMDLSILVIIREIGENISKNAALLSLLEELLILINDNNWGLKNTFIPSVGSIEAQYIDRSFMIDGIIGYSIKWKQSCLLGNDRFADKGNITKNWTAKINMTDSI